MATPTGFRRRWTPSTSAPSALAGLRRGVECRPRARRRLDPHRCPGAHPTPPARALSPSEGPHGRGHMGRVRPRRHAGRRQEPPCRSGIASSAAWPRSGSCGCPRRRGTGLAEPRGIPLGRHPGSVGRVARRLADAHRHLPAARAYAEAAQPVEGASAGAPAPQHARARAEAAEAAEAALTALRARRRLHPIGLRQKRLSGRRAGARRLCRSGPERL